MLTLTIKDGHSFKVGDATIYIDTQTGGRQVKVHIDAPREVPIVRTELFQKDR